jgi:prephenate dehydrogenase
MGAEPRELDTSGHRRLLEILRYVRRDTWELFVDMQSFNPYALKIREDLLDTLEAIHKEVGELSAKED